MCGYYYSHLHKKVNIPFLIDFLKQKDIQFSCKIKNYKNMTEKIAKIDRIKLSGFNVNHLPPPYGKPPKNSHISTTILSIHGVIKKITGLRAGVIQDAHMRGDYQDTLIWPIRKKNRQIESVLLLCDMKTGKYLAYTEEDAIAKQVNIPEGFEIEFFYTHKKRIQK